MKRLAVLLLATTATASAAPLLQPEGAPPAGTPSPAPAKTPPGAPQPAPPETPASMPAPPPSEMRPAASQLLPPSAVAPSPQPGEPQNVPETTPNLLAQVVVGGTAGAAGIFLGGYIGYKLDRAGDYGGEFDGLGGLVLGAAIGLTVATTAGVMLVGHDRDHDASVGLTWLGTVGGGIVGGLVGSQLDSPTAIGMVVVTGTALGGALMHRVTRTRSSPAATVRVVPFASGSGFGLALVGNAP